MILRFSVLQVVPDMTFCAELEGIGIKDMKRTDTKSFVICPLIRTPKE